MMEQAAARHVVETAAITPEKKRPTRKKAAAQAIANANARMMKRRMGSPLHSRNKKCTTDAPIPDRGVFLKTDAAARNETQTLRKTLTALALQQTHQSGMTRRFFWI